MVEVDANVEDESSFEKVLRAVKETAQAHAS